MSRKKPLTFRLSSGVLSIQIGIDTLKNAAERHDDFWQPQTDKCALVVSDPHAFAKEVFRALQDEEEDGSTMVTRLLDDAIKSAVEGGAEGLDHDAMNAIEEAEGAELGEEVR